MFKLRCRYAAFLTLTNLLVFALVWRWFRPLDVPKAVGGTQPPQNVNRHVSKLVTVVIRQWERFDNDMAATLQSVRRLLPNGRVVVVSDGAPYPPFDSSNDTQRLVNLQVDISSTAAAADPLTYIKTKYALFVPDSMRIASRQNIQRMLAHAAVHPNDSVAVAFSSARTLACQRIDINLKEWSLRYDLSKSGVDLNSCDAVAGKHALLMPTDVLKALPKPFMLPFPESLYLQTAVRKIKVHILSGVNFSDGRALFRTQPSKQHLRVVEGNRRNLMYQEIGFKKITREGGNVEWHGCTRDTERCFPPVVGIPSYLTIRRWTPPCCLAHLRRTLRHTLSALQQAGARFWLEGATLLGAVRGGDILPWASNLEVGINEADIARVQWLTHASNRGGAQDPQGFVWEKATQGEYYRVLFSRRNRLHVNVLPFRQRNGTMAKDSWFVEHQSDFPDHFLHPMSSIELAGKPMPCPNNVRDFLELKFGKGIIEQTTRPGSNLPYP